MHFKHAGGRRSRCSPGLGSERVMTALSAPPAPGSGGCWCGHGSDRDGAKHPTGHSRQRASTARLALTSPGPASASLRRRPSQIPRAAIRLSSSTTRSGHARFRAGGTRVRGRGHLARLSSLPPLATSALARYLFTLSSSSCATMLPDMIRDSPFGLFMHTVSRGKLFRHPEEQPDYVVPSKYLRHSGNFDDQDGDRISSRSSESTLANTNRPSVDAATLVGADQPVKRASPTEQEKRDREEWTGEKRQQRERDLEAADVENEEEQQRRQKERENHPGTADPIRAHKEGLIDKYQYLVDFEENDPANPQYVSRRSSSRKHPRLTMSSDQQELVAVEEALCRVPDRTDDDGRVHRQRRALFRLASSGRHELTFSPRQIYTVSEQNLGQVYGVSQTVTVLGLTLFILGYGIGPSKSTIPYRGGHRGYSAE